MSIRATETDTDLDDLLDFTFENVPRKARTPRPDMDRLQADQANAEWLVDQGIVDADPLSTRNRK